MNLQTGANDGRMPLKPQSKNSLFSYFSSHPIGFWFFFWGELAERCSYYGMRAILLLYMAKQLGLGDDLASVGMSLFIAGCYILPLIGGYLADNYFGKYWTIVGFSIPYILGHVILGFESVFFLVLALVLLAMGSGVIKPNISTLMGMTYDQQRPGQEKLRGDAFAMFYWSINIGAALSTFAMPILRNSYGYAIAFLFPAGLMVIAFAIFALGKRHYGVEVISKTEKTPEERQMQWLILGRIFGLFLVVTFFWMVFDQSASTWTLFARDHLDLTLFGLTLAPDQIQGLNPILIIIILPLITLFWKFLDNRGFHLRPTDKMLVGFVLTASTMGVMALAGFAALGNPSGKVSVAWEAVAYIIITCAEIMISVVGLELAFTAAPKTMKSFVTACWLLTVALANYLNAGVTLLYNRMDPGPYFAMLTGLMVVVTIVFFFVARQFNRKAAMWQTAEAIKEEQAQIWPEGFKTAETGIISSGPGN